MPASAPWASPRRSRSRISNSSTASARAQGISLSLYANKTTAFIGRRAAAKSTLLRILNRMYDLYPGQRATGEVLFDGETCSMPASTSTCCAPLGMCFRSRRRSDVDLREHRLRHPSLRAPAARRDDSRVEQALRRPPCGMKSRTSSARPASVCRAAAAAALHRPHRGGEARVILFDEPCSRSDPISTRRLGS